MDAFLILGQIPGTEIQITFNQIAAVVIGAVLAWLLFKDFQWLKSNLSAERLKTGKQKFSEAGYTDSNGQS